VAILSVIMISPVDGCFLCQTTPFFNKRLREAQREDLAL
jgi:hypothetical protein